MIRRGIAVVFLFNGAEESLQDASHMFITQHEIKHTIRAVINLEACGTAGAEVRKHSSLKSLLTYLCTDLVSGDERRGALRLASLR